MSALARAQRWFRLEGCTLGAAFGLVVPVYYAGEWHNLPRSAITAPVSRGGNERDGIMVEEWLARKKGWL